MINSISVIIPAYNEESSIYDCLRSVSSKSGLGYWQYKTTINEVIVVDNASTDNTSKIATQFGAKVVCEPHKGITRARQAGYRNSTGDVLAFLDADCRAPDGWLKRIRTEFSKDPKIAVLSGPYTYYDLPPFKRCVIEAIFNLSMRTTYRITGCLVLGGNFAIRRDALDKMGGFDTSIEFYGEDTNIARRALPYGKVKFLSDFVMNTSARRLVQHGLLKTVYDYVINYFSEVILKRPASKEYRDYR